MALMSSLLSASLTNYICNTAATVFSLELRCLAQINSPLSVLLNLNGQQEEATVGPLYMQFDTINQIHNRNDHSKYLTDILKFRLRKRKKGRSLWEPSLCRDQACSHSLSWRDISLKTGSGLSPTNSLENPIKSLALSGGGKIN